MGSWYSIGKRYIGVLLGLPLYVFIYSAMLYDRRTERKEKLAIKQDVNELNCISYC